MAAGMNVMKEILAAVKSGGYESLPDGRVAVFTNPAIREGYILEKDEFKVELQIKPEYLPGAGNRYAAAIVKYRPNPSA